MDVLSHCWWFLGTKKWDGLDIFLLYLLVERVSCLLLLCFLFFSPPLFLGSSGCLRRMIYLRCFFSREEQTSYFFIDMLIFFLKKTKQKKKQWCFHRGKKTTLSLTVYVEIASFFVTMAKSWYAFEQSCDQCFLFFFTPPSSGYCTATYQRLAQSVLMNALYNPANRMLMHSKQVSVGLQKVSLSDSFKLTVRFFFTIS